MPKPPTRRSRAKLPHAESAVASQASREADLIYREIRNLDGQLREERADLLRRLNNVQASTRELPPETLILIFEHATYSTLDLPALVHNRRLGARVERKRSTIRLASVCWVWRQIVWSTPGLWTTLVITLHPDNAQSCTSILRLCLKNVGLFPFSLGINFKLRWWWGQEMGGLEAAVKPVLEILFARENAVKLEAVQFCEPPIGWTPRFLQEFSQIETLVLERTNETCGSEMLLDTVPQLHTIILRGVQCLLRIPSTLVITTLDLFEVPMGISIRLLVQCPNLIECHYRSPMALDHRTRLLLPPLTIFKPVSFPHLKDFTWSIYNGDDNGVLLEHIRLPSLRVLRLYDDPGTSSTQPIRVLAHFFAHLPTTLSTLELVNWRGLSTANATNLFHGLTNLQALILRDCLSSLVQGVIRSLRPETTDIDSPKCLPGLKIFHIHGRSAVGLFSSLMELMSRRHDGAEMPFFLGITRYDDLDWLHRCGELKAAIQKYCVTGYQVQLGLLELLHKE